MFAVFPLLHQLTEKIHRHQAVKSLYHAIPQAGRNVLKTLDPLSPGRGGMTGSYSGIKLRSGSSNAVRGAVIHQPHNQRLNNADAPGSNRATAQSGNRRRRRLAGRSKRLRSNRGGARSGTDLRIFEHREIGLRRLDSQASR